MDENTQAQEAMKKVKKSQGRFVKTKLEAGDQMNEIMAHLRDCRATILDGMNDGALFALDNMGDHIVLQSMVDVCCTAAEQAQSGLTPEELDSDNAPGVYAAGFGFALLHALGDAEEKEKILKEWIDRS